MPDDDEDRITADSRPNGKKTSDDLPTAAVSSVTDAIGRGINRRARRETNLGRSGTIKRDVPLPTSIIVGTRPKTNGNMYVGSAALPYRHLTAASESEDDSNDEWEEAVGIDARTAKRAVRKRQRVAAREAERLKLEDGNKDDKDKQNGDEKKDGDGPTEAALAKAKKDALKEFSAAERAKCTLLYDVHMALLLSNVIRMDTAADAPELQAIALSMIPEDLLNINEKKGMRESLARFALWARTYFRPRALFPPPRTRRPASQIQRSTRALNRQNAHVLDIATALAAALRAVGVRARIVVPILPHHYTPRKPPANLSVPSTPKKGKGKKNTKNSNSPKQKLKVATTDGEQQRALAAERTLRELQREGADLYAWMEVWCSLEKAWLPVDFFNGTVDMRRKSQIILNMREHAKELLERAKTYKEDLAKLDKSVKKQKEGTSLPKKKPMDIDDLVNTIDTAWLARIISAEGGQLTDVTRRYVTKWKFVEKERARSRTRLEVFLREFSSSSLEEDEAMRCEKKLFNRMASSDEIPTSVTALHKHPSFVLQRHLKKYETVHPAEPVGFFKDTEEPIYLRASIIVLHSKERWRREMKQVRDDAVALKHVKSVNRESEEKTPLYAEHQTEALIIPAVVDGKVPRGPRGNLELWTPDHVPAGGVHVAHKYAAAAARALSIDYVEAMTGFDVRSGRSVPRIEGVVVAQEFAGSVWAAAAEKENIQRKRQEAKAKEEAAARWKALLKAMLARVKVRQKYGNDAEAGTYLQQQKKAGVKRAREEKMREMGHRAKKIKENGDGPIGDNEEDEAAKEERREMELAKKYDNTRTHTHEFVKERIDDGDEDEDEGEQWVKTCTICKLTVAIDKL